MNKTPVQKQPMSVYTVMLIVSTLLMLAACIMMFVELYRYGSPWDKAGKPAQSARSIPVLASLDLPNTTAEQAV